MKIRIQAGVGRKGVLGTLSTNITHIIAACVPLRLDFQVIMKRGDCVFVWRLFEV